MIKIAVLYYSRGKNTKETAEVIAGGMNETEDVEARIMSIDEADSVFISEAHAVVFGTPTYYANISWQMKKWFDESRNYKLEGKLGAAFATEDYIGGGADVAIQTLVSHMMVKGMLVYSGCSALGHPYIHLGAVMIKSGDDSQKERAKIFGQRIAKKAKDLFEK